MSDTFTDEELSESEIKKLGEIALSHSLCGNQFAAPLANEESRRRPRR